MKSATAKWVLLIPAVHLVFCLIVAVLEFAPGWVIISAADFPVAILGWFVAERIGGHEGSKWFAVMWYGIAGTLWWWLISFAVMRVVRKLKEQPSQTTT